MICMNSQHLEDSTCSRVHTLRLPESDFVQTSIRSFAITINSLGERRLSGMTDYTGVRVNRTHIRVW